MILTTHAIVGAAAGRLFSDPFVAFSAGFASHFIIDAIPHWAYNLKSRARNEKEPLNDDIEIGKKFVGDLARIGLDFIVGIFAAIFIFQGEDGFMSLSVNLLSGVAGGIIPDFMQFLYFKIRQEPFIAVQKLHIYVHQGIGEIPALPYGLISQVVVIAAAILISKAIF